jgi:site-specific recombinase XerD
MLITGLRRSELPDMKWEGIDFGRNTLKVRGKGAKERTVLLEPGTLSCLP